MHDEASGQEDSEEDCTVNEMAKVGVWGWQRWRCGDGKGGGVGMAKVEVWGWQRWGCGDGGITQVEIRVCQNIREK